MSNKNYDKLYIPIYKDSNSKYQFNQSKNKFHGDLVFGQLIEEHLAHVISNSKFEVKHDMLAQKTGNIYIEYQCANQPSGVMTSGSDYYAIFLSDTKFLVILKEELISIVEEYKSLTRTGGDRGASAGICIPIQDLMLYQYKRPLEVTTRLDKVNSPRLKSKGIIKYTDGKVELYVDKNNKPHVKLCGAIHQDGEVVGILDGGVNFYNDELIFKKNKDYSYLGKWKYVYENEYIKSCLSKDTPEYHEVTNLDLSNTYLGMNSIHKIYLDFKNDSEDSYAELTIIKVDVTSLGRR